MRKLRSTAVTIAAALSSVAVALTGCAEAGPGAVHRTVPPANATEHYHDEPGVHLEPLQGDTAQLVVQLRNLIRPSAKAAAQLAEAEQSFAFRLTRALYSESPKWQNVLVSPLSADTAL